jgi:hypothetical protein
MRLALAVRLSPATPHGSQAHAMRALAVDQASRQPNALEALDMTGRGKCRVRGRMAVVGY